MRAGGARVHRGAGLMSAMRRRARLPVLRAAAARDHAAAAAAARLRQRGRQRPRLNSPLPVSDTLWSMDLVGEDF